MNALLLKRILTLFAALIFVANTIHAGEGTLVRSGGYSLNSTAAETQAVSSNEQGALGIRLQPSQATPDQQAKVSPLSGVGGSIGTTVGGLAITLGVFAIAVLVMRKMKTGTMMRGLPREAFEVIGQTTIGPKQQLMVVRCGLQALVIGVSPAGIQTIAQFDDPDEAGQFIAQCRGLGTVAAFNSTLREIEREQPARGFVASETTDRPAGKLFLRA